ncbi:hypothetical protein DV735_g5293, partial [Chaetothyriales sp. CBS 134920]
DSSGNDDNDILKLLNGDSPSTDHTNGAAEALPTEEVPDDSRADSIVDQEEAHAEDEAQEVLDGEDEVEEGVDGREEAQQQVIEDEAEREVNGHDEAEQEGVDNDKEAQEGVDNDKEAQVQQVNAGEAVLVPTSDPADESSAQQSPPSVRSRASSRTSDLDCDPGKSGLDPGPDSHVEPSVCNTSSGESVQIFDHVEVPVRRTAEPDEREGDSDQHIFEIVASDGDVSDNNYNNTKRKTRGRTVCPECSKVFIRWSLFQRHVVVHSPPEFFCPFCETERLFRRRDKVIDHVQRCHSPQQLMAVREMAIDINIAPANTSSQSKRAGQGDINSQPKGANDQERGIARFVCPLAATYDCRKTFKRQKTAVRHSHTHLEEYPCICGKVFLRNDNLVAHFRTKHPNANIKLLKPRTKPPVPAGKADEVSNKRRRTVTADEVSNKRRRLADLGETDPAQLPQKKSRTADSTSHGSLDSGIAMAEDEHHDPSSPKHAESSDAEDGRPTSPMDDVVSDSEDGRPTSPMEDVIYDSVPGTQLVAASNQHQTREGTSPEIERDNDTAATAAKAAFRRANSTAIDGIDPSL